MNGDHLILLMLLDSSSYQFWPACPEVRDNRNSSSITSEGLGALHLLTTIHKGKSSSMSANCRLDWTEMPEHNFDAILADSLKKQWDSLCHARSFWMVSSIPLDRHPVKDLLHESMKNDTIDYQHWSSHFFLSLNIYHSLEIMTV